MSSITQQALTCLQLISREIVSLESNMQKIQHSCDRNLSLTFDQLKALFDSFSHGYESLSFLQKSALNDLFVEKITKTSNSLNILFTKAFHVFTDVFCTQGALEKLNSVKPVVQRKNNTSYPLGGDGSPKGN